MFYSFINFHVVKHMHYMGEVYYICSWMCIYRVSLRFGSECASLNLFGKYDYFNCNKYVDLNE